MEMLNRQLVIHVEIKEVIGASSMEVYKPRCSELKEWWAHLGSKQETEKENKFVQVFIAVNKSACWRKAIIWFTLPCHSSSIKEVRARILGGKNRNRDTEACCLLACSYDLFSLLSYSTQDHLPSYIIDIPAVQSNGGNSSSLVFLFLSTWQKLTIIINPLSTWHINIMVLNHNLSLLCLLLWLC